VHVGGLEQLLEQLLAAGRQVVDVLLAGGEGRLLHHQRAVGRQALEARVERAEADAPEGAELQPELLAQLVAGHGGLLEQAEHGEFEHEDDPSQADRPSYRPDVSDRSIVKLDRPSARCQPGDLAVAKPWPSR
jgi:hypothetical protein